MLIHVPKDHRTSDDLSAFYSLAALHHLQQENYDDDYLAAHDSLMMLDAHKQVLRLKIKNTRHSAGQRHVTVRRLTD